MNQIACWMFATVLLAAMVVSAEEPKKDDAPAGNGELKNNQARASYAIGKNIGKQIKDDGLDLDIESFVLGLTEAIAGKKSRLTDAEIKAAMIALQEELTEKRRSVGEKFLADNAKKEGVKQLPSGLQYKVIKEGKGAKPKASDEVTVNYRGTLIDGTQFDASEPGNPISFPVNGVIKGWTEALQLMTVGSKWELYIPSELAYGARGAGGKIGPNATLIFEVELLGIK